jgi:LAS superfamily LD-carboxypeptidase LdcB
MAVTVVGPLELTGRSRRHVAEGVLPGLVLHRDVARAFARLRSAAARAGIDLVPASAFRDFDAQVRIWNQKWRGERPLRARDGRLLDAARLKPAARVAAILAWSAPPGASRHHWGTDLDVYDPTALAPGQRYAMVPAEYAAGGPFAPLSAWLDANIARFGFYRPYVTDRGGVMPEPWHLSHAPTAREFSRRLRLATLRGAIEDSGIEGKGALLAALPRIYARYVRAVDPPPRVLSGGPRGRAGGRASAGARSPAGSGRT